MLMLCARAEATECGIVTLKLGKYLVRFNLAHIIQRVIVVVDNYYVTRFVVRVRKVLRHKLSFINVSRIYSETRRGAR